ncbi:MAG: DUF2267 domain-containing protein [Acidimicrobiia bacterium]
MLFTDRFTDGVGAVRRLVRRPTTRTTGAARRATRTWKNTLRPTAKRAVGGAAVAGGLVLLRPGTHANKVLRRQVVVTGRRLRHFGGRLRGLGYRLRGGRPDPGVVDEVLADRIRSSLGTLEKRLDIPHVHVMAEDHVVLLHGSVSTRSEADEIEQAVAGVSGVRGVESYLHVGLGAGDTRPSEGRAVEQPSEAMERLLGAAKSAGLEPRIARPAVRAILATFADRLPPSERDQVATHLPADVRELFAPPRRMRRKAPPHTVDELVSRIAGTAPGTLPADRSVQVTEAVLRELRSLVPEERADVAAVLPAELKAFWEHGAPA